MLSFGHNIRFDISPLKQYQIKYVVTVNHKQSTGLFDFCWKIYFKLIYVILQVRTRGR